MPECCGLAPHGSPPLGNAALHRRSQRRHVRRIPIHLAIGHLRNECTQHIVATLPDEGGKGQPKADGCGCAAWVRQMGHVGAFVGSMIMSWEPGCSGRLNDWAAFDDDGQVVRLARRAAVMEAKQAMKRGRHLVAGPLSRGPAHIRGRLLREGCSGGGLETRCR